MKEKMYYIQDAIGIGHSVPESKLEEFRKYNEDVKKNRDKYRQRLIDIARRAAEREKGTVT